MLEREVPFRHEFKYPIHEGLKVIEETKICMIAEKDPYAGKKGFYNIRSLYFDDYDNSCYMENENGVDNREKFRIRIYDCAKERISLEIKQKIHGKTHKESCLITYDQCRSLMSGVAPEEIYENQRVLRRLVILMETRLMQPAVIVQYDRIPYIYRKEDANVRVTFDQNIIALSDPQELFDREATGRGVLPVGVSLMEVKYDSFLPDEVYALLQMNELSASTFSKYYLCRKFSI